MAKIVVDSSALILLAKCGLIEKLCDSYQIVAPSSVIDEVASENMIKRFPDAAIIADLISNSKIKEQNPETVDLQLPLTLGQGETDALFLARELKNSIFATDDGKAIRASRDKQKRVMQKYATGEMSQMEVCRTLEWNPWQFTEELRVRNLHLNVSLEDFLHSSRLPGK